MKKLSFVLAFTSLCTPIGAYADTSVQLEMGARHFQHDVGDHYQSSLFVKTEATLDTSYKKLNFTGKLFASVDQHDEERRYADIRRAKLSYEVEGVELSAGVDTFFWGRSETINILNTLNQIDFRQRIDGKAKMGQSFVGLDYEADSYTVQVLYLPSFRAIDYPDRPSPIIEISEQNTFEKGADNGDVAARVNWFLDDIEFAVSYFSGTRRDPLLLLSPDFSSLSPQYINSEYLAFDGLAFIGDATLKAEMKTGKELGNTFYAHNIGIEYTQYPAVDFIQRIAWVAEYLLDDRNETAETLGQNDIFIGAKAELGELGDINIRPMLGVDLDNSAKYLDVKIDYRMSDYLKIGARAYVFMDIAQEDTRLAVIKDESFFEISLAYAI